MGGVEFPITKPQNCRAIGLAHGKAIFPDLHVQFRIGAGNARIDSAAINAVTTHFMKTGSAGTNLLGSNDPKHKDAPADYSVRGHFYYREGLQSEKASRDAIATLQLNAIAPSLLNTASVPILMPKIGDLLVWDMTLTSNFPGMSFTCIDVFRLPLGMEVIVVGDEARDVYE